MENNTREVIIEKLNINGEGICSFDGKKCGVRGVLPDENVLVTAKNVKETYVEGQLLSVLSPSPNRITPPCPYASQCGGCDMMFAEPHFSLALKKQVIQDYFSEYYRGNIQLFQGSNKLNYRNKVAFVVKDGKIGLQERQTNNLIEINSCIVAKSKINQVLDISREYISHNKTSINHIVVRELSNSVCVVLVAKNKPNKLEEFIQLLRQTFGENFGLYININSNNKKEILSNNWHHICGQEFLTANELNLTFFVYPHAFLQINDEVRIKLYQEVSNSVQKETVIEGYSGVGILSCVLSKNAKHVYSIEINPSATKSANKTKQFNHINNLTNINGDFGEKFSQLMKEHSDATVVIDPPRSGIKKEALDLFIKHKPNKIVYVSCNPYTLKQNIGYLRDYYKVEKIELFDIFPQTSDIETLAILTKI